MKPWAEKFYTSEAWKSTRLSYLDTKQHLCERCMAVDKLIPAKVVHHKVYLTRYNINDPNISLNHKNLEALCQDCHNKEHHREESKLKYKFDKDGNLVENSPHKTL